MSKQIQIQNLGGPHSFGTELHFAPMETKPVDEEVMDRLALNPEVVAMFTVGTFRVVPQFAAAKPAPAVKVEPLKRDPSPQSDGELAALLNNPPKP